MGVGHGVEHLLENREKAMAVLGGRAPSGEPGGEGLALDQLHGEERPLVGQATHLVDRHHARVLEPASDPGLLEEAFGHGLVPAVALPEHLDGHGAVELGVASMEHRAYATVSDLTVHAVPACGRRRPNLLEQAGVGHGQRLACVTGSREGRAYPETIPDELEDTPV